MSDELFFNKEQQQDFTVNHFLATRISNSKEQTPKISVYNNGHYQSKYTAIERFSKTFSRHFIKPPNS